VALADVMAWPVSVLTRAVVVAVVFSAAIGIFFGYCPACAAANLEPIEAFRFEG
jgi:putative ABC transport system permease protein